MQRVFHHHQLFGCQRTHPSRAAPTRSQNEVPRSCGRRSPDSISRLLIQISIEQIGIVATRKRPRAASGGFPGRPSSYTRIAT
jgi:hypothetical protein